MTTNPTPPVSTPPRGGNEGPKAPALEQWTLTFRAAGQGPPTVVRVRKLLKIARRAYGLACTDCRAADAPNETHDRAPLK